MSDSEKKKIIAICWGLAIGFVLIVLLIVFATNPSEADHKSKIVEYMTNNYELTNKDNPTKLVENNFEYNNYYLYSKSVVNTTKINGNFFISIGILGNIPIVISNDQPASGNLVLHDLIENERKRIENERKKWRDWLWYLSGKGVAKDKAINWYKKAALKGYAPAQ